MTPLMLPYVETREFLDPAGHAQMLDWTCANAAAFHPALIDDGKLDISRRHAMETYPPREIRHMLRDALKLRLPDILQGIGMRPFRWQAEMQITVHGDGAMFTRHIDTGVHHQSAKTRRLSAVYYFHREPKGFDGGCLRMYALRGGEHIDIEPRQNMLLAFPSYAPHEVTPIRSESRRFEDARFAVNIWLHDAVKLEALAQAGAAEHAARERTPVTAVGTG